MNGPISSGGSCRSMSIGIRMSPCAWSMPAVRAASLPKLRDRFTSLIRRSRMLRSRRRASVLSREPSLTNTISNRKPALSRKGSTEVRKRSIDSSSLNTGTTSDRSGSAGRRARWAASWRSRAEADLAGTEREESGTPGSLHYCLSGDDRDCAGEIHDPGVDGEAGLALRYARPELVQRLGLFGGLERLVGAQGITIGHEGGAAIAVREANHAFDSVKLNGDGEIVPER